MDSLGPWHRFPLVWCWMSGEDEKRMMGRTTDTKVLHLVNEIKGNCGSGDEGCQWLHNLSGPMSEFKRRRLARTRNIQAC